MSAIARFRVGLQPWLIPLWYGVTAALLGAAASLVLPPTFVSRAELTLSSSSQTSVSGSLLGLAAQFGLASASGQGSPDFLVAIMTSEDYREAVVTTRFSRAAYAGVSGNSCDSGASTCDLVGIWAISGENRRDTLERAAKHLLKIFSADVNPTTGLVDLSVEGRTPSLAKAIGDRMVQALDSANLAFQRQAAESQFSFLAVQVDTARDALHDAEDALARFDIANRSVESSPELRLQRVRLQRDLTLSESFYTQLAATQQQAYLAAANTASSLSVLQSPNLPGRRERPKRRIITMVAFAFGVLFWGTRRYWPLLYPEVRRVVTAALAGDADRQRA